MLDSTGPAAFDRAGFQNSYTRQSSDQDHDNPIRFPQSRSHVSRSISEHTSISTTNITIQYPPSDHRAQNDTNQIGSQDTHNSSRIQAVTIDEPSRSGAIIPGNKMPDKSNPSTGSPPGQQRALSGLSPQQGAGEFQLPLALGQAVSQEISNQALQNSCAHPTEVQSQSLLSPPTGHSNQSPPQVDTLGFPECDAFDFDFDASSAAMDLQMSPNMMSILNISPSMMPFSPSYLNDRLRRDQGPRSPFSMEQLKRIQKLWPRQKTVSVVRLIRTLWRDTVQHGADNLFSDPDPANIDSPSAQSRQRSSRWNMDEDCRNRLMSEVSALGSRGPPSNVDSDFAAHSSEVGQMDPSPRAPETQFPSTGTLETSLDFFFRSSYPVMSFIHRATFDARKTPTPLLFPMCLIGLSIMDPQGSKDFVRPHLVVRFRVEEVQRLQRS
jgi:hypothetical protein